MARLNITLYIFFVVICCCNWSNIIVASRIRCRTAARTIGHCDLFENCPALRDTMLYMDLLNNQDCANSGLIGVVVCCPRSKTESRRRTTTGRTTTTPATTTTPTTTTTITAKPTAAALPSRFGLPIATPNTPSSELLNFHPDGLALLNKQKCGRVLTDRVAFGTSVALDEFPWVAMLLYANKKPRCGGSVITERFVLTAAHCIKDDLQIVRLGEHTVSTESDCIADGLCVTYKEFGIEKAFKHPNYNYMENIKDIALIKLNGTVTFAATVNIKPICLPTQPEAFEILPNSDLTIAGWGLKENNESADILQKGLLKPEALNVCKAIYSRYSVDDSKICTRAGVNNSVSCGGDSGGPLFWKARHRTIRGYYRERYTQIGLVSFGYMHECGSLTNVPFMFESVANSMAWITHTILN
ncbi:serine protease grass-like [Anastrepha ludens]|uniref:serine protease grass-like n=1 Tax=Anastrepha ludens TaxID=28586 RepID=UPI0023B18F63|nr:serine protease grass-like [Anastrepha ludens]